MPAVLLDTGVFSFVFKRDTRAALYAADLAGAQPCLSFQSVAELRLWSVVRRWGEPRRQRLGVVTGALPCLALRRRNGAPLGGSDRALSPRRPADRLR